MMFTLALVVSSFFVYIKEVDALSYDSANPYSTGCAYKNAFMYQTKYIYRTTARGDKVKLGYVQLWGSAYCHTAWAKVYEYGGVSYNGYADAFIHSMKKNIIAGVKAETGRLMKGNILVILPNYGIKPWDNGTIGNYGVNTIGFNG